MDYFYSVYAGGVEVNDHSLTEKESFALAGEFILAGYDDVYICVENVLSGAVQWLKINNQAEEK